ncbi:hypothetical protein SAMN05192561_10635 [Halopenitus malekzadehii]|uniref:Uncharacterized protein n=1 Tax=Halopenitus malekzadehii TaxID=1267564 RepID=A0A1H6J450_9EURY|nr:DUF5787 family protein [Halopenitus malekzadehii]SEH55009.1 hypothetical protein SAMN05192561_10635 [Halopenitus malekzadehii]
MVLDAEFGYELLVCRWAELAWRPAGDPTPVIVGRQVGTRKRRWDTVVVEVDPDGLRQRRTFGDREIDRELLEIVREAPADWEWYRDALPEPEYPWRYVREAIHRAADRGLIDERASGSAGGGRIEIRRKRPYPDWVRRVVAIENKPDLDASAAAALADQLAYDVDAGLLDETWLATEATGSRLEPALRREIPIEAGIVLTDFETGVDPDSGTVAWLPSDLRAAGGESGDGSGSGPTDPDRETRRLVLAERVYGRGWRSFHDTMRPDCRHFRLAHAGEAMRPDCAAKGRCPTARECSGSCASFSPEPPAWRTQGWPIEGGPGKGITRLLERRRDRARYRTLRR